MGEFIDEIHEEIVTEAECADETQLSKERTDMLRGWADAYATKAAESEGLREEIERLKELLGRTVDRLSWQGGPQWRRDTMELENAIAAALAADEKGDE